jgi:hypothetical protein
MTTSLSFRLSRSWVFCSKINDSMGKSFSNWSDFLERNQLRTEVNSGSGDCLFHSVKQRISGSQHLGGDKMRQLAALDLFERAADGVDDDMLNFFVRKSCSIVQQTEPPRVCELQDAFSMNIA